MKMEAFQKDAALQAEKGNKAAGQRARCVSLEMEPLRSSGNCRWRLRKDNSFQFKFIFNRRSWCVSIGAFSILQYLPSNPRTSFCIGQCMMMVIQLIAASCCHGVQLVIFQFRQGLARSAECIVKRIVGIVHLIDTEHRFQTTFIKRAVMSATRSSTKRWPSPHSSMPRV